MSKARGQNTAKKQPTTSDEVIGKLEAFAAPPAGEGVIQQALGVVGKVLGLRDKNRQECPRCSRPGAIVLCSANNTGAYKTYYYCDNRKEKGCRYSYHIVRPSVQEKLRREAKGEQVKTPVQDGGNYGGIERVE